MRLLALVPLVLMLACKNSDLESIPGPGQPPDYRVFLTDERLSGAGCLSAGQQCTGHFVGYVEKRSDNGYVAAPNTPVYITLQSDRQSSLVADTTMTTDATGDFTLDWTFATPSGSLTTFTFCGGPAPYNPADPGSGCARVTFRG